MTPDNLERVIEITQFKDGLDASCKWNNRRCYVYYEYATKVFMCGIKGYFKGSPDDDSFAVVENKKGVKILAFNVSQDTFQTFLECQKALIEQLEDSKINII